MAKRGKRVERGPAEILLVTHVQLDVKAAYVARERGESDKSVRVRLRSFEVLVAG